MKTSRLFPSSAVVLFLALLITSFSNAQQKQSAPTDTQIDQRVTRLLQQMTVEEKAGQMMQYFHFLPEPDEAEAKARRGAAGSFLFITDPKSINKIQHAAVDGSRTHIPVIFGFDVIHGWRTIFPVPIAMAASWNPTLIEQAQTIAAREASASGINWTFAPMLDIARDARWGRIIEGAGEDPFLGSAIARAQVRGFQGDHLGAPDHLLATVKHFAAYGAAEGGRDYDATYLPDTLLWNIYLPPYKAAVDAGASSVMSAYQDLNDVPASGNRWLLHDVLRNQWGFKGFIVSDAAAVFSLTVHGYARDPNDAALKASRAGVNMEMAFPEIKVPANSPLGNPYAFTIPGQETYITEIPKLVKSGQLSVADLDALVRPILTIKMKLGLFEHPYVDESKTEAVLNDPAHRQFARTAAPQTFVLLRNENNVLPLSKSLHSVAVIGTLADSARDIMGSWVFVAKREETVTVVQGIKNKLPNAEVTFVRGAEVKRPLPSPVEIEKENIPDQSPAELQQQIAAAVEAARKSDVAIVVLGERQNMSGEAASRSSLEFPGAQQQMLEAVVAVGKPVVVVLLSGRPLNISWAASHVPAILQSWYPGSEGGNAIADALFGDSTPGGKLPMSWPRSAGQEPLYYNHNLTQEHETKKDFTSRYWDDNSFPLYPFGYGLTYTTFAYSNLRLSSTSMKTDGKIDVSIDVQNTGTRTADEVVQLYIHQQAGSTSRPIRELKGFERITLKAGEKRTLTFPLTQKELQYWSSATKQWVVEPEKFDVWVGTDSTAKDHAEFKVTIQ